MLSRFCNKTVLSFLIITLLIPSGFFLYPPKAQAQATSCIAQIAAAIGFSAATEETTRVPNSNDPTSKTSVAGSFVEDCIFKPLVVKMAKALLNEMTRKTVAWINSGFQGNPGFELDFGGMLQDTADEVIGDFIAKEAPFLCSQFSFKLRIALAQSRLPYKKRAACTLTKVIDNVTGFIDGNNSGGWDNWLQVTTVPQNNAYGAFAIAQDEISRRIVDVQAMETKYLDWGSGFKNWKFCEKDSSGKEKCTIETPGVIIQDRLSATLNMDLQQIGLANDLNAIYDALTNQLAKQVMGAATTGLLGGNRGARRSVIDPSDYNAAARGTVIPATSTDPLAQALSRGLIAETNQVNAALSNPAPTDISNGTGPTGTPTIGGPTGTDTLNLQLNPANSIVVNDSNPLFYEISLNTNYRTNGLFMRTAFKDSRSMTDVPFALAFTNFEVEYVRADGSPASYPIKSAPQATEGWSGIWTDNNAPFTIRINATKKAGAILGNYTLQTVVYDERGNTLDLQDHAIIVQ